MIKRLVSYGRVGEELLLVARPCGEPALAYALTLLEHLEDAPKRGERHYAKNGGKNESLG